jgi:hypothetical protein
MIQKTSSYYRGETVSDAKILKYVGIDTYKKLKHMYPYLYQNFIESKVDDVIVDGVNYGYHKPLQIQVDFLNLNLTGVEIKRYIIADFLNNTKENWYKDDVPYQIENLRSSSWIAPGKLQVGGNDFLLTFIFILVFVGLIIICFVCIYTMITRGDKKSKYA